MAIKNVLDVKKNTNLSTVTSVVVGLVAFGAIMYGIRRLPDNNITTPVKDAANKVA